MAARIIREATGTVLSDKMDFFHGWISDHPDQSSIKTVNNVTVFQPRGRLEWIARVTFAFCNAFPNSSLARMATLRRAARRGERFFFVDRYNQAYLVRVKGTPQPERDEDASTEYYYLDLDLLVDGFE